MAKTIALVAATRKEKNMKLIDENNIGYNSRERRVRKVDRQRRMTTGNRTN
jgi:hypothetical protein